jgi:DnaJ-class molecular chaperone
MSREQALEKRIADLEEGLRKALEYIDQSIEDLQRRLREKQPCTNCGGRGTVYSVWYRSDIACTDCNGSGMY